MRRAVAFVLLAMTLSGCVQRSYVALLEHPAGGQGGVTILGGQHSRTLQQAGLAMPLSAGASSFAPGNWQLRHDFAGALAVQPVPAERFVVRLGPDGQLGVFADDVLGQVLHAMRQREHPLVVVTGHTDTLGPREANLRIGLQRAQTVVERLQTYGLKARVQVRSLGELDLLVMTPDATPEVRNRRVEIEIR